jgi:hypothetical protein
MTLNDLSRAFSVHSRAFSARVGEDDAIWWSGKRSVQVRRLPKGWVVEQTIFDDREVLEIECKTEQEAVATFCALLPPTVKARLRASGNEGSTPSGGSQL